MSCVHHHCLPTQVVDEFLTLEAGHLPICVWPIKAFTMRTSFGLCDRRHLNPFTRSAGRRGETIWLAECAARGGLWLDGVGWVVTRAQHLGVRVCTFATSAACDLTGCGGGCSVVLISWRAPDQMPEMLTKLVKFVTLVRSSKSRPV